MKLKSGRISALFLISAVMIAGCSSPQPDGAAVPTGGAEDYVTVSLFSDVNFWDPPVWDTSEGTITGKITEKTGVALDITVPPQDGDTRLSLMLLYDELPDLISVTDATIIGQLVSSGKVWDLEEFFERYAPDSHNLKVFPEDMKQELIKRDGGWYAFPSHINSEDASEIWEPSSQFFVDYERYSDNNGILWNRRILELAGLTAEDVQTEEQVLAAFERVKNLQLTVNEREVIPLLLDGKDYVSSTLKYLECSFGAEYLDEEGNYRDIILQPETRHALSFLNQTIRSGYAYPEQLTLENDTIKQYIADGNVFCFIGNIANTGIEPEEWISSGPILSSDGESPVLGKTGKTHTGWMSTFISKECENPEAIAAWIDYMTSDEGLLLSNYGEEGIDYVLNEEGLVVRTEEGEDKAARYNETGISAWWMFNNRAWERKVLQAPEEGEADYWNLKLYTAYGENENTVIYDNAAFYMSNQMLPSDSKYGIIDAKVNDCTASWLPVLLLADNRESFERLYEEFIGELTELGIEELDMKKNEITRKNCEEYQISVEKIN